MCLLYGFLAVQFSLLSILLSSFRTLRQSLFVSFFLSLYWLTFEVGEVRLIHGPYVMMSCN